MPRLARRLLRTGVTAAVTTISTTVLATTLTAGSPAFAATAAPVPAVPANLPSGIEALTAYVPQTACDTVSRTGTAALAKLLTSTYTDTSANTWYQCATDGTVSEHYDGRAVDWMISSQTPNQLAEVKAAIDWLLAPDSAGRPYAMARRLGVQYIIYNSQIWGAYRASDGWRPYSCSGVSSCHQDHVHISLSWNGAMGRTSFYSGTVSTGVDYGPCRTSDLNWAAPYTGARSTACPSYAQVTAPAGSSATVTDLFTYSGAQVAQGATGPVVRSVQAFLGLGSDGQFGPGTKRGVVSFQTAHGLSGSGVVDAATWRALLTAATSS